MTTLEVKPAALADSYRYIKRDLSLLEFQRRVLEEAQDENNPLLERLKFMAIFGSNMDEFFMLRIAGVRNGDAPAERLAAVRQLASELYAIAFEILHKGILPKLEKTGIHLLDYITLTKNQKERINEYFTETVYPLLVPLPLSEGHPFPHISNLYLNLAVVLRDSKGRDRLMRLQVPETLPRLIPVKRSSGGMRKDGTIPYHHYFVWLEDIITANLSEVFPSMKIVAVYPFRIIRDASLQFGELESADPLESMQESIQQLSIQRREYGAVVQVAITQNMPAEIRELLAKILEASPEHFYVKGSPLGLRSLWQLYSSVERSDLKYPLYVQALPKVFKRALNYKDLFAAIRRGNIMLHHPYDSFSPVVHFLKSAARDPKVLSIKQTLYRVGKDSPIVDALVEASRRGKQVTALIELKATFDEESNVGWARVLEESGVRVIHGLPGLKTHCKICMVMRREAEGIRRYVHLSTGNYNAVTSRLYEDIGLFTSDEVIGADGTELFNYLSGYPMNQGFRKFMVAPVNLRMRLQSLIRREIEHARSGFPAHLIFKVNALVDSRMIDILYEASRAGVHVDLLVRGMCSLRPGVPGLSENINVISIVGRYLEHSRIFYFLNGGHEEVYLGSADLMERNIEHRVEILFPLEDPEHIRRIRKDVLDVYLRDNQLAYLLQSDGRYVRKNPRLLEPAVNVQNSFMQIRKKS